MPGSFIIHCPALLAAALLRSTGILPPLGDAHLRTQGGQAACGQRAHFVTQANSACRSQRWEFSLRHQVHNTTWVDCTMHLGAHSLEEGQMSHVTKPDALAHIPGYEY